jgi:hypothetical protein
VHKTALILTATLALAACDRGHKQQDNLQNAKIQQESGMLAQGGAPAQQGGAPVTPGVPGSTAPSPSPVDNSVPVAFQGRWGMVPKDCGPDAAIAKGLMTVTRKDLRFYESVAKPAVVNYPTPMRMEGRFSFSGEGMDWSKDMVVSVEGDTLIRTEKDPVVRYTYTKCTS